VNEVTAVVLHKGALARYNVEERGKDRFVAHLLRYSGDPASSPPHEVMVEKQGRHCIGSVADKELMEDIYYAAKEQLQHGR
jgi:hypothetical protein